MTYDKRLRSNNILQEREIDIVTGCCNSIDFSRIFNKRHFPFLVHDKAHRDGERIAGSILRRKCHVVESGRCSNLARDKQIIRIQLHTGGQGRRSDRREGTVHSAARKEHSAQAC